MTITLDPPAQRSQPGLDDVEVSSVRPAAERAPAVPALRIEHLSKRFVVGGRRKKKKTVVAVNDVSLQIEPGEIYGILGANGSGKSTFIRLVSTLLTVEQGRVEVFGHDIIREEMAGKRLINRVSVDAACFKKLPHADSLVHAARLYDVHSAHARREIVRILGRLGIAESRLSRPLAQMSRWMQQQGARARAFLTSPVLLLLDEPTTGLD